MTVTIITGAAGGIGQGIARRLARSPDAALALVGRSESSTQQLADELRAGGTSVLQIAADLSTSQGPRGVVDRTVAEFGRLDGVVSNAGVKIGSRLTDLSDDDFDVTFAVNSRATFVLAKAAYPHLVETKGAMVVTASMAASSPAPFAAYSPSKAAVLMIVQQFAREWGAGGVRINAVSPGMILTPMSPAIGKEEFLRERDARIPLGRHGDPDDVAGVVTFLLGPDAAYVTGENIAVDGGVRGNFVPGVIGVF